MIVYDYYAAIGVAVACVSSFVIVYVFTPFLIQWLKNKKLTVPNAHASGNVMVSHPGGPAIMSGIAAGCLVLYAFSQQDWIIAVLMTTIIAFVAGLVDDLKRMGGWFKPLTLAAAAIPLIALDERSYGTLDISIELAFTITIRERIATYRFYVYAGMAIMPIVPYGNKRYGNSAIYSAV